MNFSHNPDVQNIISYEILSWWVICFGCWETQKEIFHTQLKMKDRKEL